jgi:hypothetical protein
LTALWSIECVPAAAQLQISHREDCTPWLDSWSSVCIVSEYSSGTLEGGQIGDNFELFGQVFGVMLVFWLLYYYINHNHA